MHREQLCRVPSDADADPASQAWQLAAPGPLYIPAGQLPQYTARPVSPSRMYRALAGPTPAVPAGQLTHAVAPALGSVPGPHSPQPLAPVDPWAVPGPQPMQLLEPVDAAYVPAEHELHPVAPEAAA